MNIKIIIYFLIVFYLYYISVKNINSIETMENNANTIKDKVRNIYLSDVIAIKYLSKFSEKIQKEGLTINSDVDFKGKLIIPENGEIILGDKKISNFDKIITNKDVVTFRSLASKDINNDCLQTKKFRNGIGRHVRLQHGTPSGYVGRNIDSKHKLYLTRKFDN
jgi:hypothetical protein